MVLLMHSMLNFGSYPFDSFEMTKYFYIDDDTVKGRGGPLLKHDISTGIYSTYKNTIVNSE